MEKKGYVGDGKGMAKGKHKNMTLGYWAGKENKGRYSMEKKGKQAHAVLK